MNLESLKNGKFEQKQLSKEALMRINGGRDVATGADNNDKWSYSCCGTRGELYDCTVSLNGKVIEDTQSPTMFKNTVAEDYD